MQDPEHEIQRGNPATSRHEHVRSAWAKGLAVLRPTPAQLEHGLELHRQSMVIDTFSFMPLAVNDRLEQEWHGLIDAGATGNDFHFRSSIYRRVAPTYDPASAQMFLEAFQVAGVTGMMHTAAEGKSLEEDVMRIAASLHTAGWFGDQVRQMRRPEDLPRAHEEGAICIGLSVNGPPCPGRLIELDDETRWLDTWYHLGVRQMHLSYNRRNVIATGCAERHDGGLSELGYDFIRAMNRTGIVVDVPHSSENTCLQAAETSSKPIMASHAGCQEIFEHIRNKSDRVLKAIAGTGGLVGIVTIPKFLGHNASLHTFLNHVDYAVKLIGADHVAIGTDTCAAPPFPSGYRRPTKSAFSPRWWGAWDEQKHFAAASDELGQASLTWTNWPLFTVGMVMRGHSDEAIRKILGLNLLRVLKANQPERTAPVEAPALETEADPAQALNPEASPSA